MAAPLLVVITGPPGSGKTTLGRRLASDLGLPFLYRDGFKERLYETLGAPPDVESSQHLGRASYALLYHAIEAVLAAGQSAVAESNFDREMASPVFREILTRCPARVCQIRFYADGETLYQRIVARSASGERHSGHRDAEAWSQASIERRALSAQPLDLPACDTREIDTADFAAVDYAALLSWLKAARTEE